MQKESDRSSSQPRLSIARALSHLSGGKIYADRLASTLCEGDIFLFKGHQFHDNAIRCCTASDYNHVAIVVENGGELQLFEATAAGVGCVPLEFYVNSFYWSHMSRHFHKVRTAARHAHAPHTHALARARRWWCAS